MMWLPAAASGATTETPLEQELEAMVVSAPLERRVDELARPASVLSGSELRTQVGPTIGATLQNQPGINNQSFGPGVGQPVIRGLSGPRVRIMENGIGNNDVSNISPDHANSIEPSQAERVEVLRGPSTLLYGSGAIGGIVNVIDGRVPDKLPPHWLGGALNQTYDSALDQTSSSLKLEGGGKGLAYHIDGFYRNGGNVLIGGPAIDENAARITDPAIADAAVLDNTYGFIPNSNTRAKGGTVGGSWIGDEGFAGGAVNYLENNYGVPPLGIPGEPYVRINLRQSKYDFRSGLDQPFALVDKLRARFGFTSYQHQEIEGGELGTTWRSDTFEGRLELNHAALGPITGQWGFQAVTGWTEAVGEEATVPYTQIADYGVFLVESLKTEPVTYDFGFRIEPQRVAPAASSGYSGRGFLPVSGSISALWPVDPSNSLSLAITESQRGPQAQELYVNGVHRATRAFEIGDPDLGMETSYNLELGWTFRRDRLTAEVNLFNNWIDGYIYNQYTGEVFGEGGGAGLPILRITQNDAVFRGYEAKLTAAVLENRYGMVDFTVFTDYTRGLLIDAGNGNVPRMPPLRYGAQVDYAQGHWSSWFRVTRGQPQNDPGELETPTPGWILMNVGLQYEAKSYADTQLLFFLKGNNLLNQNIRNSTSYLKSFAPEPGRGAEVGIRISY